MRAHHEGCGACSKGVAVRGLEADDVREERRAVVIAVFEIDQKVRSVVHALRVKRVVEVG